VTLEQMINRVNLYVRNRPGLDDTIIELINEEMDKLAMPFEFNALNVEAEASFEAEERYIELESGLDVILYGFDLTNDVEIKPQDMAWYNTQHYLAPSGYPKWYIPMNNRLYLRPVPSTAVDLVLRGKRWPTPLADPTDEPEIPRDWHQIVCKFAASELLFALKESLAAMDLKNAALADLSSRQEQRTMELRNSEGRVIIDRSRYRRGSSGTGPIWR
jgi:hypothetical protein